MDAYSCPVRTGSVPQKYEGALYTDDNGGEHLRATSGVWPHDNDSKGRTGCELCGSEDATQKCDNYVYFPEDFDKMQEEKDCFNYKTSDQCEGNGCQWAGRSDGPHKDPSQDGICEETAQARNQFW